MGIELPTEFLARMQSQLGDEYAAYLRAMAEPVRRALRVNTKKIAPEEFERLADFPLAPVPEAHACYRFPDDVAIGKHPLHMAGLCYVQEPSAQQPVRLLGVRPGMTVLDLCAAPGGKSGQIAELLCGEGLLIANEPVPARAQALLYNLERLGATNAAVTNLYPEALCPALANCCDAVLVDAPCSGEGMFRREPDAIADWSTAHVAACAERQARILDAAAQAVRPGGTLVYSTCTFSQEENEGVVNAFLAEHPQFYLEQSRRLYPHTFPGEGQFMAKMTRRGAAEGTADAVPAVISEVQTQRGNNKKRPADMRRSVKQPGLAPWDAFCKAYLSQPVGGRATLLPDGRVVLLPETELLALAGLRILRAGVLAGEIRGGRFLPAHALFLAYPAETFLNRVDLAGSALGAFLSGETIPCEASLSGWCAATFSGHCVGFGKAVSGTLKNHLPKGLRRQ